MNGSRIDHRQLTEDEVRKMLERSGSAHAAQSAMHPQDRGSALAEIDELIHRHGPDAVAEDFIRFE